MYKSLSYRLLLSFLCLAFLPMVPYAQVTDSIAMEIAKQMDEEMAKEQEEQLETEGELEEGNLGSEEEEMPFPGAELEEESAEEEEVEEEVDPSLEEMEEMEEEAVVEEEIIFEFEEAPMNYGNDDSVGKLIKVNGIGMYYEVYGAGPPLLLIHGNGGDIASMSNQIDHFKSNYKVIVADSRGHGNSELGTDNLNYVQMADDWMALVNRLGLDSVSILGWSDGGIIGLLLAIKYPEKVTKLAAMGANLQPDKKAVRGWAVDWVGNLSKFIDQKIAEEDNSKDWFVIKQQMGLLRTQPNIPLEDLKKITAPVLLLSGDNDIIKEEHTVEMYQNIPNAQMCIFPGETHFIPSTDPVLFNMMVDRFLSKPFTRPTSKELMFKK